MSILDLSNPRFIQIVKLVSDARVITEIGGAYQALSGPFDVRITHTYVSVDDIIISCLSEPEVVEIGRVVKKAYKAIADVREAKLLMKMDLFIK